MSSGKIKVINKNLLNKKELFVVYESFNRDLSVVGVYYCKLIEFLLPVLDYAPLENVRIYSNINMKFHNSDNYVYGKSIKETKYGYKSFYKNEYTYSIKTLFLKEPSFENKIKQYLLNDVLVECRLVDSKFKFLDSFKKLDKNNIEFIYSGGYGHDWEVYQTIWKFPCFNISVKDIESEKTLFTLINGSILPGIKVSKFFLDDKLADENGNFSESLVLMMLLGEPSKIILSNKDAGPWIENYLNSYGVVFGEEKIFFSKHLTDRLYLRVGSRDDIYSYIKLKTKLLKIRSGIKTNEMFSASNNKSYITRFCKSEQELAHNTVQMHKQIIF